jgi:hypothetical protein
MNATARPSRAFYVRKRWDGSRICLIHLTDLVELDVVGEAAWDLADGSRTVMELIAEVGKLYPPHDRYRAPQEIVGLLITLINARMMTVSE